MRFVQAKRGTHFWEIPVILAEFLASATDISPARR
jgi:hypothetical protein